MGINNYRCLKCEGKNCLEHGLYCPNHKKNRSKLAEKIKQQEDELYAEKENPYEQF
jgi:hypothetical protein